MSLFSGIGHIFHGIANFFEGGDDDAQKKQQQQQQQQQQAQQQAAQRQASFSQPQNNNAGPKQIPLNLITNPNALVKSNQPAPAQQPEQMFMSSTPPLQKAPVSTPNPQPHASIWHDITHNPVTNVVGSVVKPVQKAATQVVGGLVNTPEAIYREVQDKPINDIQQRVFGTTDSGKIFKDIVGDTGTLALTAAAPGIDSVADAGISSLVPDAAENLIKGTAFGVEHGLPVDVAEQAARDALGTGTKTLIKAGAGAAAGGTVNTGFGAINGMEAGQSPLQILEKAPENFGVGAALGAATPFVGNLLTGGLKKFAGKMISAVRGDANVPAPDELSMGVKSSNPSQVEDAAATHQAQNAQAAAAQISVEPLVKGKSGAVLDDAQPAPTVTPTPALEQPINPDTVPQPLPEAQPVEAGATPAAAEPTPVNQPAAAAPPPAAQDVNPQVKNARFQNAQTSIVKDPVFKAALQDAAVEKDGEPLSQLNEKAVGNVQKMDLPTLVQSYGADFKEGDHPVATPEKYYETLQAIRQLYQYKDDPTAANAAANALAAVNDYAYEHGRGLAATKLAYEDMPAPMKVAYLNKLVEKAGGKMAEGDMTALYQATDLQTQLAETSQKATQAVNELSQHASTDDPNFTKNMQEALAIEKEANAALYAKNRDVVDLLTKNMPKSPLGDRIAQSARTSMLSSVGGRAFALINTGFNAANYVADNTLSKTFARGVNAVGRKLGRVTDANAAQTSYARPGTLIKGAGTGFKGLAKETFGKAPVKDVAATLKGARDGEYSHDNTRYGFIGNNVTAPLRKIVRFGVGSHLAATRGIADSEIESAARQSADQLGVPKENLSGYLDFYKAHPPSVVADEADQAWKGVNNLHNNKVSDAFGKMAQTLDNKGGKGRFIAQQIRTTIIPFSHYMGGFLNKSFTDRNLLYNAYRIARARSPQELSDQLAHAVTNTAAAAGIGYVLARNGTITTKDQDGNSYDGLYFHVGNRYIPVDFAGQAAMPIIMGAELHNHGANPVKWAPAVTDDILKATGEVGSFGGETGATNLAAGKSEVGVPQTVGAAVRQHIPGIFGDINSGLDYSGLNPTHEKALTKATSLNTATNRQDTNYTQTEINKTKNAIPGISQTLPRQAGEQAHDFLDRVLHSGQESGTQKAADVQKQQVLDQSQADQKAGIPDPNGQYDSKKGESFTGAVNDRIANNQYDQAIPALEQKLKSYGDDKNVDPKTTTNLKNQIAELNVTKSYGNNGQDVRQLYKTTTLTQWRDMGDPTSDTYDLDTYQLLWDYDTKLAKAGVAGDAGDTSKSKFTAKDTSKSDAKAAASHAADLIKSNTIGSLPEIKKIELGNLAPQNITNVQVPALQKIPGSQLIKARKITVTSGV